jgi:hypothetical protein
MGRRVDPGVSLMVAKLCLDRRRGTDANIVSISSGDESVPGYTGGHPTPTVPVRPC